MANPEHVEILKQSVEAWNEWRRKNAELAPDLSEAILSHANLGGANLSHANLIRADLRGSNLRVADLRRALLRMANLSEANLVDAELGSADLSGATLLGANLRGATLLAANLRGANLSGADLTESSIGNTNFDNVDLRHVNGLQSLGHLSPSTIGIATIYRSEGKIPQGFLRGAGVPENFITFMKSLTGSALEFYSCFISYSTKDQAFADRLYADLQSKGVRCWFAPHDIQGGRKIHDQIDEAIRVYDKLLLILSDASMNSNWVKTEIANARAREEQQKRQMLFPITVVPFEAIRDWKLFDADRGIDSASEIREYFIPDFSNWKDDDQYQKAFDRLLRDLKAESKAEDKEAGPLT
jgi:hypothetical protein